MRTKSTELLGRLSSIVGSRHVLVDDDLRTGYETDWTGRFSGSCLAVIRPGDTGEVAAVLGACAERGVTVVPQGGNTGLVGGSVPRAGGRRALPIILSLRRLDWTGPFDDGAALLRAGAGATLAAAQKAAAASGHELGIDLSARDSATLGGMVATNAGGMHVIRHGTMRARVAGLEAVLANGEIVARMSGLYKDNLGWDLVSLLAGSEGTLAVVTAVALRCVPVPACRVTALVALGPEVGGSQVGGDIDARSEAFAHAVDIARELRRHVEGLEAVEIVDRAGMVLAASVLGLPAPPRGDRASGWLTVEAAGAVDPSAALSRVLEGATGVLDVAVGTNASSRERLWAYRERQSEAIASLGVPHKIDICLPSGELSRFAERLSPLVAEAAPGARIFCFGHVGDGNLHVNVIGAPCGGTALEDAVLRLAVASGGSISAEHGIGVAKIGYLGLARSPVEVELMRAVKSALDPSGTLNPGVLVP